MEVYRSNRLEELLAALVEVIAAPTSDPLASETIVVHGRAMSVWLAMRLADRFGGWVGGAFPFPRRFVHQAFAAALGDQAEGMTRWESEKLVWAVLAELPHHLERPAFDPLRRYLDEDPRPHGRYQLAVRIAAAFDQYAVFRPELVLGWQQGRDDDWQAILWRALVDRLGPTHPAGLAEAFFEAAASGRLDRDALPPRVSLFGVSTLPPFYVRVFAALSRHLPVRLFVPSPSREYWAEIRSQREALRAALRDPVRVAAPAIHEEGNPLLASFGELGRDFQRVLEAEVDYVEPGAPRYVEPAGDTMLGRLQADVLALRRRGVRADEGTLGAGPPPLPALPIAPDDESIRIHACHTPMREVEVLHDQLLALLHGGDVGPHEIVVLTPDMETYAPLVEAVFERPRDDPRHIPYAIADRGARRESPVLEAMLSVLEMVGGRASVSEVLDLCALEVVQRRFELGSDEYDTVAQWAVDAGIRWGIDARHRQEHGQPRYEENTWHFGLRRLLLGYALPGHERETFGGVLPYDEIEGTDALVLGKLAELSDALFSRLRALEAPRSLAAWRDDLAATLAALVVADGDTAWEHQQIRVALEEIAAEADEADFVDPVDLPTIRTRLAEHLDRDRPAHGFLGGGVTFCAMLPMRSLPFRVVVLLGLSDGAFPRATRHVGFDLVARHPRIGDRSRRADDRWLVLEALQSARERLVVTYVGQSILDNATLPPSVVVDELLDVLGESFVAPEHAATPPEDPQLRAAAVRRHVVVRHPMQPFSPRYFGPGDDPRLFSYAQAWEAGARATTRRGDPGHAALFSGPLPIRARRELPLSELERFFRLPAAELCKRRLGVNLSDWSQTRRDREPMELDPLEQWHVGAAILEHRLEAMPTSHSLELLRAAGRLPLGVPGQCRFDALLGDADPIAAVAQRLRGGERRPDLDIDLEIDGTRLLGRLDGLYPRAALSVQYARIGAKHRLAAWVRHLVRAATSPGDARPTVIVGRPDKGGGTRVCQLAPVADPAPLLAELVRLYLVGQREPLLLFPAASFAYAEALGRGPEEAMVEARKAWTDKPRRDDQEPHVRRIFGDRDPLEPGFSLFAQPMSAGDFPTLAEAVFGPLLRHRVES